MLPNVLMVHGFGYDPDSKSDRPTDLYQFWRKQILTYCYPGVGRIIGFPWYSYPTGLKHLWRAWRGGHWNRYYAAWDEAVDAGLALRNMILKSERPLWLIGHSLGSRVILSALDTEQPLPVEKVLFFSGADSVDHALDVAPKIQADVLNVLTPDEKILPWLGRVFTPEFGMEDVIGYPASVPIYDWDEVYIDEANHWGAYQGPYWPIWAHWLKHGEVME